MPSFWEPRQKLAQAMGTSGMEYPQPHVMASPPGTYAPAHLINYTPDTQEVHGPGMQAPHDRLNYTLLPADSGMGRPMGGGADMPMQGLAPPPPPVDAGMMLMQGMTPQGGAIEPTDWSSTMPMGTGADMPADAGLEQGNQAPTMGPNQGIGAQMSTAGTPPIQAPQRPGWGSSQGSSTQPSNLPQMSPGQETIGGRYASAPALRNNMYSPGQPPLSPTPYSTGPAPRVQASGPSVRPFEQRSSLSGNATGFGAGQEGLAQDNVGGFTGLEDATSQPPVSAAQVGTPAATAAATDAAITEPPPPPQNYVLHVNESGGRPTDAWYKWVGSGPPPGGLYWMAVGAYAMNEYGTPGFHMHSDQARAEYTAKMNGLPGGGADAKPTITTVEGRKKIIDITTGKEVADLGPDNGPPSPPARDLAGKPIISGEGTAVRIYHVTADGLGVVEDPNQTKIAQDKAQKVIDDKNALDARGQDVTSRGQDVTARGQDIAADTALATQTPMTVVTDAGGQSHILDARTGESMPIGEADLAKGTMVVNGRLVKLTKDPTTGSISAVPLTPGNMHVQTIGGRTYVWDETDPYGTARLMEEDEFYGPTQQAALDTARAQATTSQIGSIKSRVEMAKDLADLENPKPEYYAAGGFLIPPGASLTQHHDPFYGRGVETTRGGPLPASKREAATQARRGIADIDKAMANYTPRPVETAQSKFAKEAAARAAQPKPTTPLATPPTTKPAEAAPAAPAATVGEQQAQPEAAWGEGQKYNEQTDEGWQQVTVGPEGSYETQLINPEEYEQYGIGSGQDEFMGRGLTPQTGRGSTGIGWDPRMGSGQEPDPVHDYPGSQEREAYENAQIQQNRAIHDYPGSPEREAYENELIQRNQPPPTLPEGYDYMGGGQDEDPNVLQQIAQKVQEMVGQGGRFPWRPAPEHSYDFGGNTSRTRPLDQDPSGVPEQGGRFPWRQPESTPTSLQGSSPRFPWRQEEPTPGAGADNPMDWLGEQFGNIQGALGGMRSKAPADIGQAAQWAGEDAMNRQYPSLGPGGLGMVDPRLGGKPGMDEGLSDLLGGGRGASKPAQYGEAKPPGGVPGHWSSTGAKPSEAGWESTPAKALGKPKDELLDVQKDFDQWWPQGEPAPKPKSGNSPLWDEVNDPHYKDDPDEAGLAEYNEAKYEHLIPENTPFSKGPSDLPPEQTESLESFASQQPGSLSNAQSHAAKLNNEIQLNGLPHIWSDAKGAWVVKRPDELSAGWEPKVDMTDAVGLMESLKKGVITPSELSRLIGLSEDVAPGRALREFAVREQRAGRPEAAEQLPMHAIHQSTREWGTSQGITKADQLRDDPGARKSTIYKHPEPWKSEGARGDYASGHGEVHAQGLYTDTDPIMAHRRSLAEGGKDGVSVLLEQKFNRNEVLNLVEDDAAHDIMAQAHNEALATYQADRADFNTAVAQALQARGYKAIYGGGFEGEPGELVLLGDPLESGKVVSVGRAEDTVDLLKQLGGWDPRTMSGFAMLSVGVGEAMEGEQTGAEQQGLEVGAGSDESDYLALINQGDPEAAERFRRGFDIGQQAVGGMYDEQYDRPSSRFPEGEWESDPNRPSHTPLPWLSPDEGKGFTGGTAADPSTAPPFSGRPPTGGVGGGETGWGIRPGARGRPPQSLARQNAKDLPLTNPYPPLGRSASEGGWMGSESSPNSSEVDPTLTGGHRQSPPVDTTPGGFRPPMPTIPNVFGPGIQTQGREGGNVALPRDLFSGGGRTENEEYLQHPVDMMRDWGNQANYLGSEIDRMKMEEIERLREFIKQGGLGVGQDEPLPPVPPQPSMGGGMPPGGPDPSGGPPPMTPPPTAQPGWSPPVPPQDVAGIGHRFGQEMNQGEPFHSGVDLQATEGTPTISPVDGIVEEVRNDPQGLGLTVLLRDAMGMQHKLGHLKSTDAYRGMVVAKGQNLAQVGSTGNTTGSHLHWAVKDGQGQPQDPTPALGAMGSLPPVPGTQMMGPPGGTGSPPGAAPQGMPAMPPGMGGGQDDPSQMLRMNPSDALTPSSYTGEGGGRTRYEFGTSGLGPSIAGGAANQMWRQSMLERGVLGTGQDDPYGAGHMSNFWQPKGYGTGQDQGMGAGGVRIDGEWHEELADPETGGTDNGNGRNYDSEADYNKAAGPASHQGGENLNWGSANGGETNNSNDDGSYQDKISAAKQAELDQARRAADQTHESNMARIHQDWLIHQDNHRLATEIAAETRRHQMEMEKIERERMALQREMQQRQMQMDILNSALKNPWMQKLEGMTPGPNYQGGQVGGQNISALVNSITTGTQLPTNLYNYSPPTAGVTGPTPNAYGQTLDPSGVAITPPGTPQHSGADPLPNANVTQGPQVNEPAPTGVGAGAAAPSPYQAGQYQLPSYMQFRGWDPFQRAAYRADVSSLGPGVWESVGQNLADTYAKEGGTPDVTRMQAVGQNAPGRAGMEMMGEMWGNTPQSFWQEQNKGWSRAQAPQVKQNLNVGSGVR